MALKGYVRKAVPMLGAAILMATPDATFAYSNAESSGGETATSAAPPTPPGPPPPSARLDLSATDGADALQLIFSYFTATTGHYNVLFAIFNEGQGPGDPVDASPPPPPPLPEQLIKDVVPIVGDSAPAVDEVM